MVMAQPPSLITPGTLYLLLAGRRKNKKLPKEFFSLEQLIFPALEPMLAFPPLNYNSFAFALTKSLCAANYIQFPRKVKVEMMQDTGCMMQETVSDPCFLSPIPCHFKGRC